MGVCMLDITRRVAISLFTNTQSRKTVSGHNFTIQTQFHAVPIHCETSKLSVVSVGSSGFPDFNFGNKFPTSLTSLWWSEI